MFLSVRSVLNSICYILVGYIDVNSGIVRYMIWMTMLCAAEHHSGAVVCNSKIQVDCLFGFFQRLDPRVSKIYGRQNVRFIIWSRVELDLMGSGCESRIHQYIHVNRYYCCPWFRETASHTGNLLHMAQKPSFFRLRVSTCYRPQNFHCQILLSLLE